MKAFDVTIVTDKLTIGNYFDFVFKIITRNYKQINSYIAMLTILNAKC